MSAVMQPYKSTLRLRYESEEHAKIVQQCLSVDEELRPELISKTFELDGHVLVIRFAATELKGLRVAISSFLDMAVVSTKMLQEFS